MKIPDPLTIYSKRALFLRNNCALYAIVTQVMPFHLRTMFVVRFLLTTKRVDHSLPIIQFIVYTLPSTFYDCTIFGAASRQFSEGLVAVTFEDGP
jgi:hypothetical protein